MKPDQLIGLVIAIIGILIIAFAIFGYPGQTPPEAEKVYEYQLRVMDYKGRVLSNLNATLVMNEHTIHGVYNNDTGLYTFKLNATGTYQLVIYSSEDIKLAEKDITIEMNRTDDLKLDVQPLTLKLNANLTGEIEPLKYGVKFAIYNKTNVKIIEKEFEPGAEEVSVSALPFGEYRIKGWWHEVKVIDEYVKLDGSLEELVYTVEGRRVTLMIWDQNGKPVPNANVKLYFEGKRIIFGRTVKEQNTVNVTLPLRVYDVYIELYGVNTTILGGAKLDLSALEGDTFNITIASINASLNLLLPDGSPAIGYELRIRGYEGIFRGTLKENATVNLTMLPSNGWIVVTAYRDGILALNETLDLPSYEEGIAIYNITLRINYVNLQVNIMNLREEPSQVDSTIHIIDDLTGTVVYDGTGPTTSLKLLPGRYKFYVFIRMPDGAMRLYVQKTEELPYNHQGLIGFKLPVDLTLEIRLKGFTGNIKVYYLSAGKRLLIKDVSGADHVVCEELVAGSYVIDVNNGEVVKYVELRSDESIEVNKPSYFSTYILDIARFVVYLATTLALLYFVYRLYRGLGGSS